MVHVHAGQAVHGVPFWLYNLPSNLFMLSERLMITVVFWIKTWASSDFFSFTVVHGHRALLSKQQESLPLLYNIWYKHSILFFKKPKKNTLEDSGKHLISIWRHCVSYHSFGQGFYLSCLFSWITVRHSYSAEKEARLSTVSLQGWHSPHLAARTLSPAQQDLVWGHYFISALLSTWR